MSRSFSPLSLALSLALVTALSQSGPLVAQPTVCMNVDDVVPYTVARIHVDNDASLADTISLSLNGQAIGPIVTASNFTDDEVINEIKAAIDAVVCSGGSGCDGSQRFTTIKVGDTTLLVSADRELNTDINDFALFYPGNGGYFVNAQLVQMPAMVVDFDPKNPMGGFDDDTTQATGMDGMGATLIGNRDTTIFNFQMSEIGGMVDEELGELYMDAILGDPDEFCMLGARSGFLIQSHNDLPVVEGTISIADATMGGVVVVPPVIAGITPDIYSPSQGAITMTIRGYNMLDADNFPGETPTVRIDGTAVPGVTAPNKFTLEFPAPVLTNDTIQDLTVEASWGTHFAFDSLAVKEGTEFRCRVSTVNATARDTLDPFSLSHDVLFVNDSSGDALNELDLILTDPLKIEMKLPPSRQGMGNANYCVFVHLGNSSFEPTAGTVTSQGMAGFTCFPGPGQGAPAPARSFMQVAPRVIANLPRICLRLSNPRNIFIQGIVQDAASNDMGGDPMSVTNGLLVRIGSANCP